MEELAHRRRSPPPRRSENSGACQCVSSTNEDIEAGVPAWMLESPDSTALLPPQATSGADSDNLRLDGGCSASKQAGGAEERGREKDERRGKRVSTVVAPRSSEPLHPENRQNTANLFGGTPSVPRPQDGDAAAPTHALFPAPVSPSPGAAASLLLFMRAGFLHRKTRHTRRFAKRFLILDRHILFSFKSIPLKCRNVCRYTSHLLFASYAAAPPDGSAGVTASQEEEDESEDVSSCQSPSVGDCALKAISTSGTALDASERSPSAASPHRSPHLHRPETRQDQLACKPRRLLPSGASRRAGGSLSRQQGPPQSPEHTGSPPSRLSTEGWQEAGEDDSLFAEEPNARAPQKRLCRRSGGEERRARREGVGCWVDGRCADWRTHGSVSEKGTQSCRELGADSAAPWTPCVSPLAIVTDSALADLFDFSQATCAWDLRTARLSNFSYDKQQKGFTWTLHAQNVLQLALETQRARRKREDEKGRSPSGKTTGLDMLRSSSSLFGEGTATETARATETTGAIDLRQRQQGAAAPREGRNTVRVAADSRLHDSHSTPVHPTGQEGCLAQSSGEEGTAARTGRGVGREKQLDFPRHLRVERRQGAGEEEPEDRREQDRVPGDSSDRSCSTPKSFDPFVESAPGEDQQSGCTLALLHRKGENRAHRRFAFGHLTGEQAKVGRAAGYLDDAETLRDGSSSASRRSSSSSATQGTGGEAIEDEAFRRFEDEQFLMEAAADRGGDDLYFSGHSELSGRSGAAHSEPGRLLREGESGALEGEANEEGTLVTRAERDEEPESATVSPSLQYASPASGLHSDSDGLMDAPSLSVHPPEIAALSGEARRGERVSGALQERCKDTGPTETSSLEPRQLRPSTKWFCISKSATSAPLPQTSVLPPTGYFDDLDAFPPLPPPAACMETLTFYTPDAVTAHDWVAALLRSREFGSAAAVYVHWRDLQLYTNACAEGLPHWMWPLVDWVEKREVERRRAAALRAGRLETIPASSLRFSPSSFDGNNACTSVEGRSGAGQAPEASAPGTRSRLEHADESSETPSASAASPTAPPQSQRGPGTAAEASQGTGEEEAVLGSLLSCLRETIANAVSPDTGPALGGRGTSQEHQPGLRGAASSLSAGALETGDEGETREETSFATTQKRDGRRMRMPMGAVDSAARARRTRKDAVSVRVKPYAFDPFSLLPPPSAVSFSLLSLALHSLDVPLFPVGYTPYILVSFQSSLYPCVLIPGSPDSACSPFLPLPAAAAATPAASASLFQKLFSRASPHPVPTFGPSSFVFRPAPCLNLPLFAPRNQQDLVLHLYAAPPPSYAPAPAARGRQSSETPKRKQGDFESRRIQRITGAAAARAGSGDPGGPASNAEVGISLPSLPCPPPSAQGPPASLGPFLSATQPWAPSLALSLSLACPLAYYLGSVAVPSHLFGPATPQRLSLPLLPFPSSSHAVTHPLADLCRVLPSSRSSGESGASAGGLGASGRETGSAPQTSGDSRAGASAPEANPQGPLAATAVGGDKGREVKGRETKSLKADEGRIEISVLSPTLWPSYLQPVEEVFDTPQPFLDSSSVATGAAAAADAAGGGGTWLPIQQLLLQIKRLGRLRDRIAGFASLASAVTEFTSPSFSLFCLAYLLLSLLFLPSRFLAFLLFPALLVVLSRHPRAGICLLDFLTEFPLFMLFTPRRMQLQVLLSPSSSASRDSRPLACMLVLLLKHQHASWQLDPAASGSINGSDNPPQNCETFLSESPLSRASSAPPRPSCKGDSCGRCTQAEGLKHGKRKPQAEAPSRRFSLSVCGCFSPCCSPWRLPPPLPRLLLPSYEREEKDFWSTCRERGKFAELVVSTLHWTRLLLAFSVAGGAPQLSPAVAGLLCADCDFVPACGGSRSGRRGTSEGGQEARDEAARSSETRRETEEATGAEPPRSKDDRQREWRDEERGGKGEDEEREEAQEGEGEGEGGEGEEGKEGKEGEEGKEIQRGVRAQVDEEEVGGEEVAEEEEEEGRREREKGGKEKVDEGEEQEEEEERKEGRKQDERSKDGEAVEAQYREEENQGASGGSKSVGNKMGFWGHACAGGDELGRTEALLIQEEAAGRKGGEVEREEVGEKKRDESSNEEALLDSRSVFASDSQLPHDQAVPVSRRSRRRHFGHRHPRGKHKLSAPTSSSPSPSRSSSSPSSPSSSYLASSSSQPRSSSSSSQPQSSSPPHVSCPSSSSGRQAPASHSTNPSVAVGPETVFTGVAQFARKWMKKHFRKRERLAAESEAPSPAAVEPARPAPPREARRGKRESDGRGDTSAFARQARKRGGAEGAPFFAETPPFPEQSPSPGVDLVQLGSAHNYFMAPAATARPLVGLQIEPGEARSAVETRSEAEGAKAKAAGSRRPRESATTPGKRARFRDDDEEVEHWRMSPPRRQTARAVSGDEAGEAASEELDEQRHLLTSQNSWGQTSGVSATARRRPSPGHRRRREYSGETGRKTGQALLVRTGGLDVEFAFRCLASTFEQAESQGSAWKQRSALTQSWGSCLFSVFSPRFTPVVPKATLSPLVDSPFTSTRRLCSAFPGRVCRASLQAQIAAASPFVSSEIFLPEIAPDSPQRSDAVDRCPAFSEKHAALGVASRFWRTKRQGEEGLLAADYGTLNTSLVVLSAPPFSSPSSNAAALEALLELFTVRRPSRESASLFLPSLRFSCFSEASRGPPAAGRESETVSPVSIPSSQSLENDIEPPTAYSFLGWGASAPEAVEGLSPPAGPVLPTAGGPDGPGPVSDPADLETVETPLAGSSLPGGELFALYREVRASSTRFLVKLWRWVVWGEKICNLFSWRNRSLTEVAFVFAALLLLLLACVPLQYVLAVWIVHAFISGQKRGLWKLLARNSARRHVEAAIFEICLGSFAQSCKSASTTAAYSRREESGKNESAECMRPRLQKAAARPQPLLPLLRFLTVPELQQLRLSLWRRCGVALPLETLAEALDETELAEALRRGREETTVSSSRWARTDWMTNLLLHAPTDVTHQTSAVALRDSRAFWAGAELLPEETGALGSTGAETLGPTCAAGAGVCGAKRRAEAPSGYRLSDGASDSGEQETLGEGDSRELPGGLGAFTQVLFGHATQPSSGLENGEDRFTGQSAPMNAAVVDAVGGAFMQ
ncbi:putative transmembrane protein [Toxoplasma gondii VAND]|uniref:Putative transmembrane protein n=1 Tax=Toxoplasma gondii VAND TaxID=933077 RepID=A0A086PKN4_TOXGO|nr:putative transmembrane protein [Toxoplasma gondii VAND]